MFIVHLLKRMPPSASGHLMPMPGSLAGSTLMARVNTCQ
jgi:hypothetical protein